MYVHTFQVTSAVAALQSFGFEVKVSMRKMRSKPTTQHSSAIDASMYFIQVYCPQKFISSRHGHTADDPSALIELLQCGMLIQLPSGVDDDRIMISDACARGGFVLSNDRFHDHISSGLITSGWRDRFVIRYLQHAPTHSTRLVFPDHYTHSSTSITMPAEHNQTTWFTSPVRIGSPALYLQGELSNSTKAPRRASHAHSTPYEHTADVAGNMTAGPLAREITQKQYTTGRERARRTIESSSRGRSEGAPSRGYVFHCSSTTLPQCLQHALFGAPKRQMTKAAEQVVAGSPLLLVNIDTSIIMGVFRAKGQVGWKVGAEGVFGANTRWMLAIFDHVFLTRTIQRAPHTQCMH